MGFREWLIGCRNRKFPAKAKRRKEEREPVASLKVGSVVPAVDPRQIWFTLDAARLGFASLRLCGKLLLTLSLAFAASAQQRPTLAPADILRVATVSDPQISPNGDWVVYTVSTVEGDSTRSTLWLVNAGFEGRPAMRTPPTETRTEFEQPRPRPIPLLPTGWYGSNPRWSPDGRSIAFLAEHETLNGLWVVTLDRRQPRFLVPAQETNFFITYAGEPFVWSPDSKIIAYISASDENGPVEDEHKDDPRVIDRIQYKSRTSFSDRLRTHVYFTFVATPEPRQLTTGASYDHALSFSPRGDEIAFISNHELDPDAANNSDIFAVNLNGQTRQITNTKGCEYAPAWSPDGKWIAYTATKREVTTIDSVSEDEHVWVIDAGGGNPRDLSGEQDRRARNPQWSADGQSVFYLAGDRGCVTAFGVALAAGSKPAQLLGDSYDRDRLYLNTDPVSRRPGNRYQVTGLSVAQRRPFTTPLGSHYSDPTANSLIAFTCNTATVPGDVWLQRQWANARRLTRHNENSLRAFSAVEPEEFGFRSFDGSAIQGWLLKPLDWRPDRRYPVILSIHGGPHGMYSWAFNSSFQVYAARGYAVLYLNPRGSSGYGQKFADGTLNEWGGGDYRDLMLGVDEALRRYPWIDQDRMGVTGGSYGGFMTNWIITQTPRFKAAVSVASVSNLISFYATSLYQDLVHAEFGGFPWDNYELLWQWSPLRYVKQAQTPTMFIHGEQDNDVHITQAEEMYMALKRRGVETTFVRYPREGHGLHEPRHRVDALERTLAWFDRYLK